MAFSPTKRAKFPPRTGYNSWMLQKATKHWSRESSVARALDWRSKGPWFDPGLRQVELLSEQFFEPKSRKKKVGISEESEKRVAQRVSFHQAKKSSWRHKATSLPNLRKMQNLHRQPATNCTGFIGCKLQLKILSSLDAARLECSYRISNKSLEGRKIWAFKSNTKKAPETSALQTIRRFSGDRWRHGFHTHKKNKSSWKNRKNSLMLQKATKLSSRDSLVAIALDWRSKGRWFDPGSPAVEILLQHFFQPMSRNRKVDSAKESEKKVPQRVSFHQVKNLHGDIRPLRFQT